MLLCALGVGVGVGDVPKFGVAIVDGIVEPEPNEPEHAPRAAPATMQTAAARKTRATFIGAGGSRRAASSPPLS
jgi:hypothetical protein